MVWVNRDHGKALIETLAIWIRLQDLAVGYGMDCSVQRVSESGAKKGAFIWLKVGVDGEVLEGGRKDDGLEVGVDILTLSRDHRTSQSISIPASSIRERAVHYQLSSTALLCSNTPRHCTYALQVWSSISTRHCLIAQCCTFSI